MKPSPPTVGNGPRCGVAAVGIAPADGVNDVAERIVPETAMSKPFQKFVEPRPYATAEAAAKRLMEIAKAIGADTRGMIPVGAWNATLLNRDKASAAEYGLGRDHLIAKGLIVIAGCGGYIMWGPNCPQADRVDRCAELKFPAASLGLR